MNVFAVREMTRRRCGGFSHICPQAASAETWKVLAAESERLQGNSCETRGSRARLPLTAAICIQPRFRIAGPTLSTLNTRLDGPSHDYCELAAVPSLCPSPRPTTCWYLSLLRDGLHLAGDLQFCIHRVNPIPPAYWPLTLHMANGQRPCFV